MAFFYPTPNLLVTLNYYGILYSTKRPLLKLCSDLVMKVNRSLIKLGQVLKIYTHPMSAPTEANLSMQGAEFIDAS